ncbi:MAG: hypothetical protein U9R19_04185 [Bacteroidota bacterium]|nr:hypothetical protein [Bacteroidota bacterium]
MKNRIIILACVILSSCCLGKNDTYRDLSSDQIPVYNIDDTLFYSSNFGDRDTMVFITLSSGYDCESNEDYCNTEICNEHYGYSLISLKDSVEYNNYLIARHYGAVIKWNGDIRYKGFYEQFTVPYLLVNYHQNDQVYKNIFALRKNEWETTEIDSIYYSHKYGVLKFVESDGEIWKLIVEN